METQSSIEAQKQSLVNSNNAEDHQIEDTNKIGIFKEEEKKPKAPWLVYVAHSLSTWGDNMWWFAGGLYMNEMDSTSMRLTATYGLFLAGSIVLFGATLGRWIDRTRRLTAARTCLIFQNLFVGLSAALLSTYLYTHPEPSQDSRRSLDNPWAIATVACVISLTSLSRIASEGNRIILQRDWVVVISSANNDFLATMNSTLRTIELTTYMLCPFFAGSLFSFVGYELTGVIIAAWNACSVAVEYFLLEEIYQRYPDLATKRKSGDNADQEQQERKPRSNPAKRFVKGSKNMVTAWNLYFHHPVRNAGLGLALLYMTVLGFDNITYAYALDQEVPEYLLGIVVAISALVGIAGSQAYKFIRVRVGLERTGLLGMFLLVSTSSAAVLSLLLPGSKWAFVYPEPMAGYESIITLLAGITAARFGLWITDLTITQILQERVEEGHRGEINGVQESLNNTLDLVKCVLVIALPAFDTFGYLVIMSYVSICIGWLFYALYSRKQRGHLFHFSRLISVMHPHDIHQVTRRDDKDVQKPLEQVMEVI